MDAKDMTSALSTASFWSSRSTPRTTSVRTETRYPTAPSGPPSSCPMTSTVWACLSAHQRKPSGVRSAQ